MYYYDGNRVVGVLNDWDLATVIPSLDTPNTDRTGTIPFMALLPLSGKPVVHMFRHDMESFIWLFLWVCGCSNGSKKEVLVAPYKVWRTVSMVACSEKRGAFLSNVGLEEINVSDHHASNGLFGLFLAWLLQQLCMHIWRDRGDSPTSANRKTKDQEDMSRFKALLPKFWEVRDELNRQFSPKDWSDDEVHFRIQWYLHDTVHSIIKPLFHKKDTACDYLFCV